MNGKVYHLVQKRQFEPKIHYYDELNDTFVRVRYLYCGICGGDYSCFLGRRNQYPYTLGHEFVAEVLDVGTNVSGFVPGDLVVSDFNYRCGHCKYCLSGKEHLCVNNNIQRFTNRAFAEYADIDANYLYRLEHWKTPLLGTLVEPFSCVLHAYEVCTVHTKPQNVLIVGLGNIGMLFAFLLKVILQIPEVYVFDIVPGKMEHLHQYFECIRYDSSNKITFDLIIDAANNIQGSKLCLELSAPNQCYCMMSHLYGLETSFVYESLCKKEIFPCFPLRNGNRDNVQKASLLIQKYWKSEYNAMIGIYPLSEIQQTFEQKGVLSCNKQVIQISSTANI